MCSRSILTGQQVLRRWWGKGGSRRRVLQGMLYHGPYRESGSSLEFALFDWGGEGHQSHQQSLPGTRGPSASSFWNASNVDDEPVFCQNHPSLTPAQCNCQRVRNSTIITHTQEKEHNTLHSNKVFRRLGRSVFILPRNEPETDRRRMGRAG